MCFEAQLEVAQEKLLAYLARAEGPVRGSAAQFAAFLGVAPNAMECVLEGVVLCGYVVASASLFERGAVCYALTAEGRSLA